MEIILLQDVKGLGRKGALVNVREGYARNFLIAKNRAKFADERTKKALNEQGELEKKNLKRSGALAASLGRKLQSEALEFLSPANSDGVLYASLNENEIRAKLKQRFPELADSAKITVAVPIKTIGEHGVGVEISPGTAANIKVIIKAADGKN